MRSEPAAAFLADSPWSTDQGLQPHRSRRFAEQRGQWHQAEQSLTAKEIVRRRLLLEMMSDKSRSRESVRMAGLAIFGLAGIDAKGNVAACDVEHAVGEVGTERIVGIDAFADLAHSALTVLVAGTLTSDGLEIRADGGCLQVVKEGRTSRIVSRVNRPSFNGRHLESMGIAVRYITERAVFVMRDERLTLTEIAPGIDLEHDLLDHCMAPVTIAPNLRLMDTRIFFAAPYWLSDMEDSRAAYSELPTLAELP